MFLLVVWWHGISMLAVCHLCCGHDCNAGIKSLMCSDAGACRFASGWYAVFGLSQPLTKSKPVIDVPMSFSTHAYHNLLYNLFTSFTMLTLFGTLLLGLQTAACTKLKKNECTSHWRRRFLPLSSEVWFQWEKGHAALWLFQISRILCHAGIS